MGGALAALKYFFDSGDERTFDQAVEAALIFGLTGLIGMWVGDKGRNMIKNASRQKFTPRVCAGMDVYRVEPQYLEDFFKEKIVCDAN